jgi:hypothetical protein
MVALPLEEKGIFLKTQLLAQRGNSSKLVADFARAFIKRLNEVGLYQPELPPPANAIAPAA